MGELGFGLDSMVWWIFGNADYYEFSSILWPYYLGNGHISLLICLIGPDWWRGKPSGVGPSVPGVQRWRPPAHSKRRAAATCCCVSVWADQLCIDRRGSQIVKNDLFIFDAIFSKNKFEDVKQCVFLCAREHR